MLTSWHMSIFVCYSEIRIERLIFLIFYPIVFSSFFFTISNLQLLSRRISLTLLSFQGFSIASAKHTMEPAQFCYRCVWCTYRVQATNIQINLLNDSIIFKIAEIKRFELVWHDHNKTWYNLYNK